MGWADAAASPAAGIEAWAFIYPLQRQREAGKGKSKTGRSQGGMEKAASWKNDGGSFEARALPEHLRMREGFDRPGCKPPPRRLWRASTSSS